LYFLCDANFNVTTLADTAGDAVERYLYDPYGNATIYDGSWGSTRTSSSYANAVRFTGREWDRETELKYYRLRCFAGAVGAFVQRDPIGYRGGINLYQYAGASPAVRRDPIGMQAGAGTIGNPELDCAFWSCLAACGWRNPGVSTSIIFQGIGNFCCRRGFVSRTAERLKDDMRRIFQEANRFATAAIQELGVASSLRHHSALRHCYASAKYAKLVGCTCAGCLGHYREEYQLVTGVQNLETTMRVDWNNSVGRSCAGCTGTGNLSSPRSYESDHTIEACCKGSFPGGRGGGDWRPSLDLGDGLGGPGDSPYPDDSEGLRYPDPFFGEPRPLDPPPLR
jgi:RHS repeat-associated protein